MARLQVERVLEISVWTWSWHQKCGKLVRFEHECPSRQIILLPWADVRKLSSQLPQSVAQCWLPMGICKCENHHSNIYIKLSILAVRERGLCVPKTFSVNKQCAPSFSPTQYFAPLYQTLFLKCKTLHDLLWAANTSVLVSGCQHISAGLGVSECHFQ